MKSRLNFSDQPNQNNWRMKNLLIIIRAILAIHTLSFGQADTMAKDSAMISDSTKEMFPLKSDRPDKAESPWVVPKGHAQIEMGFGVEDTDPGFVYSYPSSLIKFGITNTFELRFYTEYITIQKEPNPDLNGFTPLSVGFKAELGEQKGIMPKASVIGHLRIPGVVSDELETKYLAPILLLACEHDISDAFVLSYNVGVEWDGLSPDPNFLYALSPSLNITDRLGLFVEGYGKLIQQEDDDIEFRMDAGLTYLISNNFMIDASAGKGITDNAPESFVQAGFTYRFKL